MEEGNDWNGTQQKNKVDCSPSLACGYACIALVFFPVLLAVILLPMSFQYVEYYQYGLLRSKSTGVTALKQVYAPGRYMFGPDKDFKVFKASAHHVKLRDVSVVSSDKLSTLVDVEYVYTLKKDRLIQLHNTYERSYQPVVEARVLDTIKNTAPNHTTADFFENRAAVAADLFNAVQLRMEEVYCHLELIYLQAVTIPEQVAKRQLETAIQNEANAREVFVSQGTLQRQQTLVQVNDIVNTAALLLTQAQANSSILVQNATTRSQQQVEQAQYAGLALMYQRLGVANSSHKASLQYILGLRGRTVAWHVGYNTKVATFANE